MIYRIPLDIYNCFAQKLAKIPTLYDYYARNGHKG